MAKSEKEMEYWALAKEGIKHLINNRPNEAQLLFREHPNNLQMVAGYSFVTFMDALMSFEEEKLTEALAILRETEKKCTSECNWMKTFKTKVLGSQLEDVAHTLECQIILADTQVCVAILTFLQQEFTGYLKGSWVLRKAWKIYQETYTQLLGLYRLKIGELNLPEPTDFDWEEKLPTPSTSRKSSTDLGNSSKKNPRSPKSPKAGKNGYTNISYHNMSHSKSANAVSQNSNRSQMHRSATMSAERGFRYSDNRSNSTNNSLWAPLTEHFAYLTNSFSNLPLMEKIFKEFFLRICKRDKKLKIPISVENDENEIENVPNPETQTENDPIASGSANDNKDPNAYVEPETISRLMGAVCFGYGVLQLGISLLPPSLLKLTSFLGFAGNRSAGISSLMYARKGPDMRAPLAMLALLWYHTIVRPFYALDGPNVTAGVEAATLLIEEAQQEYAESALFLFFKGRIFRLDSNISKALESFQQAVENSLQREIKLLALHEVGWCHLIQLDYENAQKTFVQLRTGSRWSRSFYTYLLIICLGATGKIKDVLLILQFHELLKGSPQKGAQLEVFMNRRAKLFPMKNEELPFKSILFWKMFVYELLFFWNALPSCNRRNLEQIIRDCETVQDEPMPGIALLIEGECYNIMSNFDGAISSLRRLLTKRKAATKDDAHIPAYGEFILGTILLKFNETKEEGKTLIQHAGHHYKDYDFDNKLQVRADNVLKHSDSV